MQPKKATHNSLVAYATSPLLLPNPWHSLSPSSMKVLLKNHEASKHHHGNWFKAIAMEKLHPSFWVFSLPLKPIEPYKQQAFARR